ncbi:MAG: anthranilate synthase component I family protein [Desulfovibrio sp.]|jgi:anthranilate synthase component 1|nr:anthranilate synthase component I family protein [Desulfovibrio sp.]
MNENTKPHIQLTLQQTARWLPADMDTPISLFLGAVGTRNGILLESAEVDGRWGRYSILACDMACIFSCKEGNLSVSVNDKRLEPLRRFEGCPFVGGLRDLMGHLHVLPPQNFKNLPPITRALYGYMGFGMAGLFNEKLNALMPLAEADCVLILPCTVLLFDHLYNRLCRITLGVQPVEGGYASAAGDSPAMPAAPDVISEPDEWGYTDYVTRIKEMLRQGEAIQVVPSVRFSMVFSGDAFTLYRRMRRINASPYMFYMRFPELTLFGSSPEIMVRCTEGQLQLAPIAGTRRRGENDIEDSLLAAELCEDPKERAEHVMLVDLGRNDLGRVARPGSVNLERYMEVERFSHVMHLTSRVTARLAEGLDALDVLSATFPAGTVSGAPKVRAMEIIRELEARPRGPYAGCIGWIGLDKENVNMDMGITIRSMWARDGKLFWQAGGGIVHDSDPESEWKEVCNKSAIMRMVIQAEDEEYVLDNR